MSSRSPLFLVPGMLCNASLWAHQTHHLEDIADTIMIETTRDDSIGAIVKRALDMAPPKFALAGLSMGGYVAFEFWRCAPERISRLALLDTTARSDSDAARANRLELIEQT